MNLKFRDEQAEYMNAELRTSCLHFALTKQISIHLVRVKYSPSPKALEPVNRANLVFMSFYNHPILASKLHFLVYYRRGLALVTIRRLDHLQQSSSSLQSA